LTRLADQQAERSDQLEQTQAKLREAVSREAEVKQKLALEELMDVRRERRKVRLAMAAAQSSAERLSPQVKEFAPVKAELESLSTQDKTLAEEESKLLKEAAAPVLDGEMSRLRDELERARQGYRDARARLDALEVEAAAPPRARLVERAVAPR